MPKSTSHEAVPMGFRRCGRCMIVRHEVLFRTPQACLFCNPVADSTSRKLNIPDVSDLGYGPEHDRFWICTTCALPYEADVPVESAQLCTCRGSNDQPKWERGDYNEKIHLCECCYAHVLRSGSKFSVWFCDNCRELVNEFNTSYGRTVIPIGRHSFMFDGGLVAGRPFSDEHLTAYAGRAVTFFRGMSDSIDVLWDRRPDELRAQLRSLRLPRDKDVRLSRYIGRFAKRDPEYTSLVSFDRLARFFGTRVLVGAT